LREITSKPEEVDVGCSSLHSENTYFIFFGLSQQGMPISMDDLTDFVEGEILGNQISSSQIENFINYDVTHHPGNYEKASEFIRKLDVNDILAIQRFIEKRIGSICDRNKSMFGIFIFLYLATCVAPLLSIWIYGDGTSSGLLLLFIIISIIWIGGFWHMAKEWKYLRRLVKKDELCKSVISERLIILLLKNP